MVPLGLIDTEPFVPVVFTADTDTVSPSGSPSPARTLMSIGACLLVEAPTFLATGGVLGLTAMVRDTVLLRLFRAVPSLAWKLIVRFRARADLPLEPR